MAHIVRQASAKDEEASFIPEEYVLLHLPEDKAVAVRQAIQSHTLAQHLAINLHNIGDSGKARIVLDGVELRAVVCHIISF